MFSAVTTTTTTAAAATTTTITTTTTSDNTGREGASALAHGMQAGRHTASEARQKMTRR